MARGEKNGYLVRLSLPQFLDGGTRFPARGDEIVEARPAGTLLSRCGGTLAEGVTVGVRHVACAGKI